MVDRDGQNPAHAATVPVDPAAADPAPAPIELERYDIRERVGAGGMGVVYKATARDTGEAVAVKALRGDLMSAHARQRFEREVQVLSALTHPGIVRYIDHGTTEQGHPYLVMEWLDGCDLATRLSDGALGFHEAWSLAETVATALAYAHGRGIVHRDIKPSNLFLVGDDVADTRILDFGIARLLDAERPLTATGAAIGTPGYMAPEQVRGDSSLGSEADVFSLGCVLFECLTGAPSFAGAHALAVAAKILLGEGPKRDQLPRDVPNHAARLLERMLEKEPMDRPEDGAAILAAMRGHADTLLPDGGTPDSPQHRPPP